MNLQLYRDEPLAQHGLYTGVAVKEYAKSVRATAYVVDQFGNIQQQYPPITSKPFSKASTRLAVNAVRAKVSEAMRLYLAQTPCTPEELQQEFAAFAAAATNTTGVVLGHLKSPNTIRAAITYYERHILELLAPFLDTGSRPLTDTDREEIIKRLVANTKVRSDDSSEREIVMRHLVDSDTITSVLAQRNSRIPELRLTPSGVQTHTPKIEQRKALPREALIGFYRDVVALADSNPKLAFFTVLVIFGMRPAEAAGTLPSDIRFYPNYCVVLVNSQEDNGRIVSRLKRECSRRPVIIPYWGRCLLGMCCAAIGEYPTDGTAMHTAVECSAAVKQMLQAACAAYTVTLDELSDSIDSDDLDDADTKKSKSQSGKIACYILRRIFAGIARSVMGLTAFETDRLMGHAPSKQFRNKTQVPDMMSPDVQAEIAQKMERYIFTDIFSLNPAVTPYSLTNGSSLPLIPFSEYQFLNNSEHEITLNITVTASEAGEAISLTAPISSQQELIPSSVPKTWDNHDRLVIGDTTIHTPSSPQAAKRQKKEASYVPESKNTGAISS